jgi:hypothetical protein
MMMQVRTSLTRFEVAYSAIIPKGFQRLAGGKLAPPPESNQKHPISRRDDSDRVFCHPFGINIIGGSITGGIRCARPPPCQERWPDAQSLNTEN